MKKRTERHDQPGKGGPEKEWPGEGQSGGRRPRKERSWKGRSRRGWIFLCDLLVFSLLMSQLGGAKLLLLPLSLICLWMMLFPHYRVVHLILAVAWSGAVGLFIVKFFALKGLFLPALVLGGAGAYIAYHYRKSFPQQSQQNTSLQPPTLEQQCRYVFALREEIKESGQKVELEWAAEERGLGYAYRFLREIGALDSVPKGGSYSTDNPYSILGVPEHASQQEIRHAFRQRMSEYHPDKVITLGKEIQSLAHEMTVKITKAYELLRAKGKV